MLVACILASAMGSTSAPPLKWAPSYTVAQSYAAKVRRPILVVLSPDSFSTARIMGNLAQPRARHMLAEFVCVHASTEEEMTALAGDSPARYPFLMALSADGKQLNRMGAFLIPQDFEQFAQATLEQIEGFGQDHQALMLAGSGNLARAQAVLSATDLIPRSARQSQLDAWAYLSIGEQLIVEGQAAAAIDSLTKARKLTLDSRTAFRATTRIIAAQLQSGQTESARNELVLARTQFTDVDEQSLLDRYTARLAVPQSKPVAINSPTARVAGRP